MPDETKTAETAKSEPGEKTEKGAAERTYDAAAAKQEQLGEGGKKALESEREARRKAEGDLTSLRKELDDFKGKLAEAIGQPAGGDGADPMTTLQAQLNAMQRETAIYRLSAQHGITDEGDLELLKSATDEAAMTKLAERLAARAESTPGTPRPDSTQGGRGEAPALNSDALEQALKSKLGIT